MHTSNKIYSFVAEEREGHILLTAQEYPWSVLQVVPTTPENYDEVVAKCLQRGMVAKHDTDKSFVIIHLVSGDQNGRYPERHIEMSMPWDVDRYLNALKDSMAQAAVWVHTNIVLAD